MKEYLNTQHLAACAFTVFLSTSSYAGFVLIDNFESYSVNGSAIGSNGWEADAGADLDAVVDPMGGGNQVGRLDGDNHEIINEGGAVPEGNVGTLFFRAYLDGTQTDLDVTIGFSDLTGVGGTPGASNYASLLRLNIDDGNTAANNAFEVYDGSYQSVTSPAGAAPIETGEWYSFWMVSDTAANTWELYMQGGAVVSQQQVAIGALDTDFDFRGGDVAVNSILYRINSDNNSDFMYIDDVYVDVNAVLGGNLVNPIPEPSTLALFGLAGVAALIVSRRRR